MSAHASRFRTCIASLSTGLERKSQCSQFRALGTGDKFHGHWQGAPFLSPVNLLHSFKPKLKFEFFLIQHAYSRSSKRWIVLSLTDCTNRVKWLSAHWKNMLYCAQWSNSWGKPAEQNTRQSTNLNRYQQKTRIINWWWKGILTKRWIVPFRGIALTWWKWTAANWGNISGSA